ncbi:hypothetical protein BGZ96_005683, partial [Linnemannia gamsii]
MALTLNHKHVIRAHESFDIMDMTILVQELCPGGDLHRKLMNHVEETNLLGLPEDEVSKWMFQVVEAFIYLHEVKGLVHRDLKPENIVLDGEDNVKVIDFGLSYYLGEKRQKARAGTQGYWAPEVEVSKKYRKEID